MCVFEKGIDLDARVCTRHVQLSIPCPLPVSAVVSPQQQSVSSPPLSSAPPAFSSSPPGASHNDVWLVPHVPATGPL